jgi:hypothetical protein
MKTLMIFLLLLGICQACQNNIKIKPEKTISVTQEQLMVIYLHGYTNGAVNQLINHARPISYDNQWKKDSLYIVNMFNDDFNYLK